MIPRFLGLGTALIVLAIDQANKLWLIYVFDIAAHQPVRLTPFFDVVFAKNPGISYSLLRAETAAGRLALLGLTLVATAVLAFWLWRTRSLLNALGLGCIVGGALGNAYDRRCRFLSRPCGNFFLGDLQLGGCCDRHGRDAHALPILLCEGGWRGAGSGRLQIAVKISE